MSVLGKAELIRNLNKPVSEEQLVVTPLLNPEKQIGSASIDIRLGTEFVVTQKGSLACIDPKLGSKNLSVNQARHHVNLREQFFLHPSELVLASTLEYFRLPGTIAGVVTSRSTWGRAGLVIATATAVHPGFSGTITLELVNHGEVPLVLYPGLAVAQITLSYCEGGTKYKGRYQTQTEPSLPSIVEDDVDLAFWTTGTRPK